MATEKKEAAEQVASIASADSFPLSLDEFCTRLSANDSRVELIGGFHHTEKAAGRLKDTELAYAARYEAFVIQPA